MAQFITKIINKIIEARNIPERLKIGILHPIHKKDKAINIPGNFRGIQIISILAKILDIIRNNHQKAAIPDDRCDYQFGFTEGRAHSHATMLLNKVIAEAKDTKEPLYVASLDIQKAFDVTPHANLLHKLFHDGLPATWWLLKSSGYDEMKTKVVLEGAKGEPYPVQQGIVQGGIGSTGDFKIAIHKAIEAIVKTGIGSHIGTTPTNILACADDVILLAPSELEMQQLIMLFNVFTNKERFKIHPTKTSISIYNPNLCEYEF